MKQPNATTAKPLEETVPTELFKSEVAAWAEAGEPMRLLQKEAKKDDPDPGALSCYRLYMPELGGSTWLRTKT